MALLSIYSTGTASVSAGTKDVTISGGTVTAADTVGNLFTTDGGATNYLIAAWVDTTHFTLQDNHVAGASGAAFIIHGAIVIDNTALPNMSISQSNITTNNENNEMTNYWIIQEGAAEGWG